MPRHLILFAQQPAREAREKGFPSAGGAELFAAFARGWVEAAELARARVTVAAPAEDVFAWRRTIAGPDVAWIPQRGRFIGERLREAAASAGAPGDRVVFVGGDVPPDAAALQSAFDALEAGADAVLAPAPDGGVSLLALRSDDHDLFGTIRSGSATVFSDLAAALAARGRRTEVLPRISDIDGRSDLRRLLRSRSGAAVPASLVRRALDIAPPVSAPERTPRDLRLSGPSGLRAPPVAA